MKKVAIGLLAVAGIALAVPAHAQGAWFGIGPVGVGFGTGPYAYDYGPYWGGSYAYAGTPMDTVPHPDTRTLLVMLMPTVLNTM